MRMEVIEKERIYILTEEAILAFRAHLVDEEKSQNTIDKYVRDILTFFHFLANEKRVTKLAVIEYKKDLTLRYASSSVNSMLIPLNGFLSFMGWSDCRVKLLKVQRQLFSSSERELNKKEYLRLLEAARNKNDHRLCLLMQVICATGIRVSELSHITVEAARKGCAEVCCKGKKRLVFLPVKLCRSLLLYARGKGIHAGRLFVTHTGAPLNRSNIWAQMKKLCSKSGILPSKVFPHNLRHLFARTFYSIKKDIIRLADILGHENINTTRIYTAASGVEHRKQLAALGLIL